MAHILSTHNPQGLEDPSGDVTVVGAQWGDEGKGKVIDWLASRSGSESNGGFGAVVRFNGGHNAGHTLVDEGRVCKVSLVPSGLMAGVPGVIGNGVVIDPFALLAEIERLNEEGFSITPDTLRVAETATLVLPIHGAIDRLRETHGAGALGTTGRGIGPAYEDKAGRRAIRVCDLADEAALSCRLDLLVRHGNAVLRAHDGPVFAAEDILRSLLGIRDQLLRFADPVWLHLWRLQRAGRHFLFEGAQSVLLDLDHGTYPFVTSSSCVASAVGSGSGVGARSDRIVIGVAKAYVTRVGAGPFPTELEDETGRTLARLGREVGTNTGRARRCGWLDAALLRQACRLGGIDRIALTKLDILDGMPELKVCTGYDIDGDFYDYLPPHSWKQAAAKPVYETLAGWSAPARGVSTWADLPLEASRYVRRIEELVELPIAVVSTGADRGSTMTVPAP